MRNPFPDWTVWGAHGLDSVPEDYKGLYRWVLPLTDLFFIWFGVAGLVFGVNTVEAAISPFWQAWWSAAIAVAAVLAGVGVSVPKLWPLEAIGQVPLIGLMVVYLILVFSRGASNPLGLIAILILVPLWRLTVLSRRWRRARIEHEQVKSGEWTR